MIMKHLHAQPPSQEPLTDSAEINKKYRQWRWRMLYSLFIGYAVFYFVRKNLSAATPGLIDEFEFSKTQIGFLWSGLYLVYGFGKFANGLLGDRANPRYFMAIGLFFSALMNVFFGLSSSIVALGIFWTLNGWFQSMGWPPCARSLTHWYSTSERGTFWGLWNASHQIGGAVILALAGWLTAHYGWRSSFIVPAGIAFVIVFFLVYRLRDTPQSLGLPTIEDFKNEPAIYSANAKQLTTKEILFEYVLNKRQIWFLALGNFFVYIVRYGAMDWAPTYLVETKGSDISSAAYKVAGFEVTGIVGAIAAGYISDKIFKGHRAPINILYMLLLAVSLYLFWQLPPGHSLREALILGLMGFLVYGPQMLVGVAAADIATSRAAATATGFTGIGGYLGGIVSGVGAGWIVDNYGWDGGLIFFIACAVVGALCFLFTWRK